MIHEVLKSEYLDKHPDLKSVEFYLCGPPAMIKIAKQMLAEFEIAGNQIAFDEF